MGQTPAAQKSQALKDATLKEKPSNITEFKLSTGSIAKCVTAKGKHVMKAQRLMDGDAEKMLPALISVCTSIDDKMVTIEELEEMEAGDFMTLMGHFSTAFQ
jgi:hypothetical protein